MNNSTVNFTAPEASTNSTMDSFDLITIMCVNSFSFLVGLPTHSYVIWLIVKGTGGVASEFLNLNFSLCEIGNCLKALFVLLVFWFSSLTPLAQFLQGLAITGRPLFQCLICVEHYLAVVHPVTFLKFKPLRYRVICSAAVWILTFGSCLLCLLFLISVARNIHTWFFFLQFLCFFSIQLFCCVAVLRALKQSGPGEKVREEENRMKRRAFYLILITTVSVTIIYVPYTMSGFVGILTQKHFPALWFTGVFCYVLAGFVQPVLFLGRLGKLPLFLIKLVKRGKKMKDRSTPGLMKEMQIRIFLL